ncbi:peptidoglycan DD-metalloendopeptidase family protein [Porphyromonadaceae bacterium W3.11]|nr:peptidoglycan DD-metalloendopeptidase family protein [Porphyromonadaceae bacterium W3.11]
MRKYFQILLLSLTLVCFSPTAFAQKKSAEVQRLENQRKAIQEAMKQVDLLLKQTATSAKQSLNQLQLLEGQVKDRQKVIVTLGEEIKATDKQLVKLRDEIEVLQKQFEKRQQSYVKSIRALQRGHQVQDQLLFILSASDFAQGLRRARYLSEYATWQKKEGEKLKELRLELDKQKAQLQAQRAEKAKLLSAREEEQKKLQEDRNKVAQEVQKLKNKQGELKKELAKQQRQAARLNKQIEDQIAKEIREAEEARRRAEAANNTQDKRKAETKGGYAMTEAELKLSGNFAQNMGKLPAPITGRYNIVGHFGVQNHTALRHVRVDNSGIDIQGSSGAEARAVFDGVVTTIFLMEGFNNSIIVRHGNYLTVYSNITDVYVTKGSKVKTGQSLGKIYSDPDLGGATQLHFQVWKERTKLNPELWIRR